MKFLITGFEAFAANSINITQIIVEHLPTNHNNHVIKSMVLPTARHTSINKLIHAIEEFDPDVILMLGQADSIEKIHIERIAINMDDFRIKDNEGNQPIDTPIIKGGPAAYFSTIPIRAVIDALNQKAIPATVSNSAGTYVCNHVFYGCAHHIHLALSSSLFGFVHIPSTKKPPSNIKKMVEAVLIMMDAIASETTY